ncbi:unnamed protein product [Arabis nemorensis]|uniref:Uncharacterized protein n=1 Tax=Arabis nemorensis TaxID=586526 RepID=A0A565BI49_9BRAS|nr:unnamed protein product [Arabis nemorensis]
MTTEVEKNTTTEVVESKHFTKKDYEAWGGPSVYWSRVAESDGFDIEDVATIPDNIGLVSYDCQKSARYPYPVLVKRYAMLGLHRYNMLEGTRFQLQGLLKLNMLQNCVSSYYMTLNARDSTGRLKPFRLDVTCSIARPRVKKDEVTTEKPFVPHFHGYAIPDSKFFDGELPDWPLDEALNDTKRFYVLKELEWKETECINLYLELLICADDRRRMRNKKNFLSNLEIVKVAIETNIEDMKPSNERLKAKCANVYITFKGLKKTPWSEEIDVERKAIIRRVIGSTGSLTLVGKLWSGENTEKRSMTLTSGENAQSSRKRSRFE